MHDKEIRLARLTTYKGKGLQRKKDLDNGNNGYNRG
jgi:hypothetical protein